MKKISLLVFGLFVFILYGCNSYKSVPPNFLAAKLTPTGFENQIYTPGQVDIGDADQNGKQNVLVLIQRSGLQIKEQFMGKDATKEDKEDHRTTTKDQIPMTLDIRLLLALPNHETAEGRKDLMRIFSLGNPHVTPEDSRVLVISAESIYDEQARLLVRGRIRTIIASYNDFNAVFTAFADESKNGLNAKITNSIVEVLEKQNVPLNLVEARVSNIKPDEAVWQASVQSKSAEGQIDAIRKMGQFLRENPDMREVYKYQMLKEISQIRTEQGHGTMLLDIGANKILPVSK